MGLGKIGDIFPYRSPFSRLSRGQSGLDRSVTFCYGGGCDNQPRRRSRMMRRVVLHGLFFLSGASALAYELVWQRLLNLVFGVSTLSVSAVLAAFMGGLALGGLLFGRWADRTRRPLRLYAGVEAALGLTALAVPFGFALLTRFYSSLYVHFEPGPWAGALLRLALSIVLLAGPAALIGGTLPIMGRLVVRRADGLPSAFSLLYAVNTLGAVTGAALTGFVFLHFLGMQATLRLAVGINGFVALSALLLDRVSGPAGDSAPAAPALPETGGDSPAAAWIAFGCAGVTGAASMGFEVAWTRILGILTSNSAYGFALILTVLLLGLGLGGFLQTWWLRRPGDSWRRLALCQWLLAAFTLGSLPFYKTAPAWLERCCDGTSAVRVFLGEAALTAASVFVPAVCMGMSLPLLVAVIVAAPGTRVSTREVPSAAGADRSRFAASLGRIYAANTLGCVAGPFLAGFVLIPWVGIQATVGLVVAASVLVGFTAWVRAPQAPAAWRWVSGVGVAAAAGLAWAWLPGGGFTKSAVTEPRQLLYYREGDNGTVTVVQEANRTRSILVDGQPVAGTAATSVIDQKMLAHLPLLLHPAPRRALTVGFGSGGTSHSMLLHGIDVDCVEIEAKVPGAAEHFRSENHDVLSRPRYRLVLDDARSWLRVAPAPYDAIVTDCTNLQYRSNGDLYTVEYFRLMKERLTPSGVAAAWVPANGIQDADLKTLIRSFRAVFPHTGVWYMNSLATDFLIVTGTPEELSLDLNDLARRAGAAGLAEDLAEAGLSDPYRLACTLLATEEKLDEYLGDGPLNTDDRPVLSYSTYGAGFRSTIAENLIQLMACRVDAARFVKGPAPEDLVLRHHVVSNELMLGHVCHHLGNEPAALAHYLRGAQLLPQDSNIRELVSWTCFRVAPPPESEAAE
jgi:spermidine synthase